MQYKNKLDKDVRVIKTFISQEINTTLSRVPSASDFKQNQIYAMRQGTLSKGFKVLQLELSLPYSYFTKNMVFSKKVKQDFKRYYA